MRVPKQPQRFNAERLWQYALRCLGGRAHSSGEMRQKMLLKAERPEDVELIISRLTELGYLNDQSFAESFASSRMESQGFGSARVLRDLRGRRVAPPVAESAIRKVYEGADESALIDEFLRRKFRARPGVELFQGAKEIAAAYRRLRRAGFSSPASLSALKRFASAAADIDEFDLPEETESS